MKKYTAGILGYGYMGKAHTYGYKTMQLYYDKLPFTVELAGVCTRDESKGRELIERHGFKYASTNEDDIIYDPAIDIIHICTPNSMHKDELIKCIKANKHIYCEKPLVLSCDEAEEVRAAMERYDYKKTAQIVYHNRFFPAMMRAKQLIDEGRVGNIFSFRVAYLSASSASEAKPAAWRYLAGMAGMGTLFDLGSHSLDLLAYLVGREYSSVFAATQTLHGKRPSLDGSGMVDIDVDDAAYMIVKLKNGAMGTIENSKISTGKNDELRIDIHGDKGAISANIMSPNYLRFYDATLPLGSLGAERGYKDIECISSFDAPGGDFPRPHSNIGWIRAHAHSLYSFMDNVHNGRPGSPSLEDGMYIQYIMEQAAISAKNGHFVDINYL